MNKVAVLLYGTIRTFKDCLHNSMKYIIEHNKADVFMAYYFANEFEKKDYIEIINTTNLNKYVIDSIDISEDKNREDEKNWIWGKLEITKKHPFYWKHEQAMYQWFKLKKCYELLVKHENLMDQRYNYIIKTRFDLMVKRYIDPSIYDFNDHNLFNKGDLLVMGKRNPMDIFCKIPDSYFTNDDENLVKSATEIKFDNNLQTMEKWFYAPETQMYVHLKRNNINYSTSQYDINDMDINILRSKIE